MNWLRLFSYVFEGNRSTIYDFDRFWTMDVFNKILCVKANSRSMKQELALESNRTKAKVGWHPEVLSSTCAAKTLLTWFDEMEPLLWIDSTNSGLSNLVAHIFDNIYSFKTSSNCLSTSNQFGGVRLLGLLDVVGESRSNLILTLTWLTWSLSRLGKFIACHGPSQYRYR